MSKASKKKKVVIEERYHGPLITNEVSLGYIKFYPWIMLPITTFLYFAGSYVDRIGIIKVLFLSCILINGFSIIFGLFNSLVNRFKSLTYILIGLVAWTVLVSFTFIGLLMFTSVEDSISARTVNDSSFTLFYLIPILLLFVGMTLMYAWYYLPQNQGKIWKINQWETYKVNSKKKEWLFNILGVIGIMLLFIAVITGFIERIFGLFLGMLITLTFPAVIVDAVYAAIYIRKHPEYEELT